MAVFIQAAIIIAKIHEYVMPLLIEKICSIMKFVVPMNIQWSPIIIKVPIDIFTMTELFIQLSTLHKNRVP